MRGAAVAAVLASGVGVALGATAVGGFMLSSSSFRAGAPIPVRHTCDGQNISPPLRWTAPLKGTRSFALLMDDPDAPSGTFTHWTGWNIAATARALRTGQRPPREGTNDAGTLGYTGPCPPSGTHRYVFRVYALRAPLKLAPGASRAELLAALRGKVLGTARLVGRYSR